MSFTPPPAAPPEAAAIPSRRNDTQDAFDVKTDAYLVWTAAFRTWLTGLVAWLVTFLQELGVSMLTVEENKNAALMAAAAAETSAQNAAVIAGAAKWQPGDYEQGQTVWSPQSLLTYRRVPGGVTASAIDPALAPDHWRLTGSPYSMPQQDLTTAGPHQLIVGIHYLLWHPDAECFMPVTAGVQEQLRVTNKSNATTPVLRRQGRKFNGVEDDLRLDQRRADKIFTLHATQGWI